MYFLSSFVVMEKMPDVGPSRLFPLMVILGVYMYLRILYYWSGGFFKTALSLLFSKTLRFLRPMLSSIQNIDNSLAYPLLQNVAVYLSVSSISFFFLYGGRNGGREGIRM